VRPPDVSRPGARALEVKIGQDTLWVNPRWPHRFERLSFAIQYRDQPLTVTVDGGFVCVASEPGRGPAIRVGCGAEQRELLPGGSVAFCATAGVEEDERVTPRAAR
jgi:trehalose/maltose hydrolase-like predicted phosphorylase